MLEKTQKIVFKKAAKKFFSFLVIFTTVLSLAGPLFFINPEIAKAVDNTAPGIGHWSTTQIDGDDSVTTTANVFVFISDDQATPGGTPDLTLTAFYKNTGWNAYAATSCQAQYTNSYLHKCPLGAAAGDDGRKVYYYLDAFDEVNHSYRSWATDTDNPANAQNYAFEATVYNTPSWTSGVAGTNGVKDGRCFPLYFNAPAATSTLYVASTTANITTLGAMNTWILLNNTYKFKVLATSTANINGLDAFRLDVSGYTSAPYVSGVCVEKFIAGATVWLEGTAINATTSAVDATSTYGTYNLYNIPAGSWDVSAYSTGYNQAKQNGIYFSSAATTTPLGLILPYGNMGGGGNIQGGNIIWTAPSDGMTGAPINIAPSAAPILIALSENASSTTVSTSTVLLKKMNPDGTTEAVSGYYVAYEAMNSAVSINSTSYDFGNEAKIIVYSATKLATSTSYVVRVTSDVKTANGNSLTGNDPNGGHTIFFGTQGGDFSSGGITQTNFGSGGAYMPPFVMNVLPLVGSKNVAQNTKIALEFNQSMDSASFSGNIELWQLDSSFNQSSSKTITAASSQTNKEIVVLTPGSNLSQARYRVNVKGGVQSSTGITMAPPNSLSQTMFTFEFEVGSNVDSAAPTILGTSLDRYLAGASYTNVPTAGIFKVSFSKPINPEAINTNNIYLRAKGSTSNLTATAEYDLMEGKAILVPSSALNATTTYILTLTGYIKDFTSSQNSLATTTYEFTTGSTDEERPKLDFANADDFSITVTFSEPMNAAGVTNTGTWPSGTTKWETSVLNPANYIVTHKSTGPGDPGVNYIAPNLSATTNITIEYDAIFKTVTIENLMLEGGGFSIRADNVTDLSGNVIMSSGVNPPVYGENMSGGPIMRSGDTFGMMGPGGGMFGPPSVAGQFTITDFGGKDPAMMGMMPVGIWPNNMLAGAFSIYMIDIPISSGKAIPAGGKIVIGPFPDESNVSGAKNADIDAKYAHSDINGPGPLKVVIGTASESPVSGGLNSDGVTVSGQTITITLGSVPTSAPDFIHLELDGIKNPTTPTQGGYKISIQTQTASATTLESFTSMPFFIMPKGKYYVVGNATSTLAGLNGLQIFGGSPSTGPLFVTTANNAFGSSTDGEFKIEGLNAGQVMLMTEPSVTVSGSEYSSSMSEPVFLNDSTTANSTGAAMAGVTGCTSDTACYYYKKITLIKASASVTPGLTVKIYGNFLSGGVNSSNLDIFAGGPNGFKVKTVTLDQNYSSTPYSATLYLPTTGDYNVGIGPAMPKGMGMAAPKMSDSWMPPKPEMVSVSGSGGTWTWTENSATPNDGTIQLTVQVADKTITGYVKDPANNAVANAEVFAYSPTEMFGTGTHVQQDGSFTLHVKAGSYKVGAFLPGAPPSGEIGVEVKSDNTIYADGVLITSLTLKLSNNIQSGYTISGYVYSDSNSQYPSADASVFAYKVGAPGRVETMTDSKGAYTLYVDSGSWKIGVYLPNYGKLAEQTLTVPPSKSGLNFAPDADTTYVTIRERVWQDANDNGTYDAGEGVARATVSFISTSSDYVNTSLTDSNGVYEIKVPPSTPYDVKTYSPELGNLPPQKNLQVTTTDVIYTSFSGFADVPTEHATTVEFTFYDALGNATTADKVLIQLDKQGAEGVSNDVYKENVATTTLKVATSTSYLMDIEVQGIPKELLTITPFNTNTLITTTTVGTNLFATTTINGYEKIKVILPAVSFVSGQVKDTNGTAVPNAVIHIEQPGKDIEFDVEADTSGNYSFRVASSTTPYLIQADKGGYIDSAVSVYASTSAVSFNPVVEAASYTISGTVSVAGSAPGTTCYVWAEKLGGGYVSTSGNCNSVTGAYSIAVPNGDWEISATVEGYTKTTNTSIVQVNSANVSGINISVGSSTTLQKQGTLGMSGSVGGTLNNKNSNFEMAVPSSTISASDSSTYNVQEKEISGVPTFTPTSNLIGDKAESISAYKMSGSNGNVSTVSGLNGSAFIDKTYTIAELAVEGVNTIAEIEQVKMGTYDDSSQNWTNLPTTITYLNSNNAPVVPSADLSNVSKLVFNGVTKHFSTIGVVNTVYDGLAPSSPTNVSVQGLQGRVKVSWVEPTTNIDGTTNVSDITNYNIWRSTSNSEAGSWTKIASVSVGTTEYNDFTAQTGTTYYYRVTADTGLQSPFSGVSGGGNVMGTSAGSSSSSGGGGGGGETTTQTTTATTTQATATSTATTTQPTTTPTTTPIEQVVIPTVTFEKPISQMTKSEIEAKISEILQAINVLKQLLTQVSAGYEGISNTFSFAKTLKYGMQNEDVKYLQIILKKAIGEPIYPERIGATGYFGTITKNAVIAFQEKYKDEILMPFGLSNGTGFAGAKTIAKLNQLLGR